MTHQQNASADQGHLTGYGSKPYRSFVLIALFIAYTLSFIDRNLIGVLAEPIINSFELTDGQFGFLAGWPFAFFYAAMGLPIAMAADRYNRVICVALLPGFLHSFFAVLASLLVRQDVHRQQRQSSAIIIRRNIVQRPWASIRWGSRRAQFWLTCSADQSPICRGQILVRG